MISPLLPLIGESFLECGDWAGEESLQRVVDLTAETSGAGCLWLIGRGRQITVILSHLVPCQQAQMKRWRAMQ
jgi:hypothetical protein